MRKNPRLQGYNYTTKAYYFITICAKDKAHYFGEISDEKMQTNNIGKIAQKGIENIEKIYKSIKIDKYIVMPNHVHMIIVILLII